MGPWIAGGVFFGIGLVMHVAVLRWRAPQHQIKALFGIFCGVLLFGSLGWFWQRQVPGVGTAGLISAGNALRFLLFYGALVFSYALTYSAVQADSPSLVIVLEVSRAGDVGLPVQRFSEIFTDEKLVLPRLQDLVDESLVRREGRLYRLTRQGKGFLGPFLLMRSFLGAGKGG